MSGVNFTNLQTSPMINPIHKLKQECLDILRAGRSLQSLAGRPKDIEYVIEGDLFKSQYEIVVKKYGKGKLVSFKKELARMINCNIVATSMAIPGQPKSKPFMCKSPACPRCATYKARTERVKYPVNTVAITMSNDLKQTKGLVDEINDFLTQCNIDWLFTVFTPFHDGTFMIRLINIRLKDMNVLAGDEEVKNLYNEFIEMYPMFEQVDIISNEHDTEVRYLTQSGVEFTSTQLYTSRPDGGSGEGTREGGKKKGYEFNYELGVTVHLTDKERKKKENEKKGVIGSINVPAVNADNVPYEDVLEIVEDAIEANCEPGDLAVMSPVEQNAVTHKAVDIMNDIKTGLNAKGYIQSDLFINIKYTQDDLDNYLHNVGIGTVRLPENIMKIKFTSEMLEMGPDVKGLRERRRIILNNSYAHAQTVMKRAMTKKEFSEKIARAIKKIN